MAKPERPAEPAAPATPPADPSAKAVETPKPPAGDDAEKLSREAEDFCAALEKHFRRAFGDMPKSADLAEIRGHQAAVRDLVRRASESGAGASAAIEELTAERDKQKDAAARSRADFLNYQARASKDLERAEESALRGYMSDLLPVLDSLDLALDDARSGKTDPHRLRAALEMVAGAMTQALKVRGLERIDPLGKTFDPVLHEPVATRPADPAKDEKPNVVAETLRAGYLWKGKVLRAAQILLITPPAAGEKKPGP